MMPSAWDLTFFVEICKSQNLSRAAERLGVSQPSLTLSIQRLEKCIGVQLLVRSQRGAIPTPAGKQLVSQAQLLLEQWDNVKSKAIEAQNLVQGRYRLGCHASVGLYTLSHFLPELLRQHPSLEINLVHDLSRKLTEQIISSQVDVGLVVNPVRHPDLRIEEIFYDDVTLWQVKNCNSEILFCDPDLIQSQSLLKKLSKFNFSRILSSSSLEVIADLVAHGAGIGILPTRVAEHASKNLQRVKDSPSYRDRICLVYRSETRKVKAIQEIIQQIRRGLDPAARA